MSEYPKINSMFKRDGHRLMIEEREYATPELAYLRDSEWLWTEKVDGTNMRLYYPGAKGLEDSRHVLVKGRTDNAQIPPKLYERCIELLSTMPLAEVFPDAYGDREHMVVLYGEGYGAGIQKGGGNYRQDQDFVLFDVKVGPWWLSYPNVVDVGRKLGLDVVPLRWKGTFNDALALVDPSTRMEFSSMWHGARPEGLVGRPLVNLFDNKGERVLTKIKVRDFEQGATKR